jgi:hypothetical protein
LLQPGFSKRYCFTKCRAPDRPIRWTQNRCGPRPESGRASYSAGAIWLLVDTQFFHPTGLSLTNGTVHRDQPPAYSALPCSAVRSRSLQSTQQSTSGPTFFPRTNVGEDLLRSGLMQTPEEHLGMSRSPLMTGASNRDFVLKAVGALRFMDAVSGTTGPRRVGLELPPRFVLRVCCVYFSIRTMVTAC